jgi:hypothetical protein
VVRETNTARHTLTLPFYCSRKVSYQSKYILQRRRWGIFQVPVYLPQELVSFDIRETTNGRQLGIVSTHGKVYELFCGEVAQLVTETTREMSSAQPLFDALSSIGQGEVHEKIVASVSRASFQVMPQLFGCVLGHLTRNHKVVSFALLKSTAANFFLCLGNPDGLCQHTCERSRVGSSQSKTSLTTCRWSCHR